MQLLGFIDEEADRKLILKEYRSLLKSCKPSLGKEDRKLVRMAFEMSAEAHKDMRRKSGEPYIVHPIAVAKIVAKEVGLGPTAIICSLLHDTVEDTEMTLEEIKSYFGATVAEIIDGLTKISSVFDLKSSFQAENFRKLLLTLARDVRVIVIKIADRLHNMRTMDSMPRNKQLKISSETLYLYAPLAHRLGLYAIKSELEDLSMKYNEKEIYNEIAQKLQQTKRERNKYINEFTKPIRAELDKQGFKYKMIGRPKSIFSIYNKMKQKDVEFDEVYDLFAIRIIIDSKPEMEKTDCWKVYSIVTDYYQPNPQRLRDWISTSKANGYESLHTTVMGHKGRWVEVQIRTERMDEIAEKGFAAHWKYKEGTQDSALDDWLLKIRESLKNPDSNAFDFIDDFKLNLFAKEIYVFTPNGDLKILPLNSTALDFAYEIHTDIGNHCIGAKVNHKLVPISHVIKNGDQIEIITSKKQKPSQDWLNFVVTGRARSRIKNALKEERRKIAALGKEMLERKFKQLKVDFTHENIDVLVEFFKTESTLDLYYKIANKKLNLKFVKVLKTQNNSLALPKVKEARKKKTEETIKNTLSKSEELLIFGESSKKINYQFAKCCSPIPGDDVFGFITVHGEIKIHRTNCPNAIQLMSNYGYRVVKTKWTTHKEIAFLTGLRITGLDDVGVMNKITLVISGEMKLNIRSIQIDTTDGVFEGDLKIYVNDIKELEKLITKLKQLPGITNVQRLEIKEVSAHEAKQDYL
jgi:GTP diphosphokinase / guanosine-3',5'-bis(diphosphate) 3'-diphosphatase